MTSATLTRPPVETGPRTWKWTLKDYYRLGELGFFLGTRVELIHGEILEMSPINWLHTLATTKTGDILRQIFAGQAWISLQNPLATPDSQPEPDVSAIPGRLADYNDHPQRALLIVEVADTTLFYDTTTKAELYATAGIEDYWVLDIDGKKLQVFRDPVDLPAGLGASAYRTHFVLSATDTISPLAVPNSSIRVSEMLP
jgi:Uma2 family endonuclease